MPKAAQLVRSGGQTCIYPGQAQRHQLKSQGRVLILLLTEPHAVCLKVVLPNRRHVTKEGYLRAHFTDEETGPEEFE